MRAMCALRILSYRLNRNDGCVCQWEQNAMMSAVADDQQKSRKNFAGLLALPSRACKCH